MSDTPDPLALVEEMEALIDADGMSGEFGWLTARQLDAALYDCHNFAFDTAHAEFIAFCSPDRIRSLCEAVRAARKDTELLDRLDKTLDPVTEGTDSNGGVEHVGNAWGVFGQYNTVREAIDAECPASPIGPETP